MAVFNLAKCLFLSNPKRYKFNANGFGILLTLATLVDGVASVVPPQEDNTQNSLILVENKHRISQGYSGYVYDINSATKDGIVYSSLDPSIFEIKYPDSDIQGRVVGDI